ncbi:unnamed protein product [Cyclocybe aegerita]|uniref:F-box domain-containing protein n=1 Tax=Cyclocybe aegerita TaxID=1973307 RepID=A0A8S0XMF3_CYCAE|nr:unnamed protein product [Cyclocybe aegerita]
MSDTPFPFSNVQDLDSLGHLYDDHDDPPTDGPPCECASCAEIASLEQIKQETINKILDTKRKMNVAHSAFIRTLPIELKVKVFELCIQGPGPSSSTPLALGAICHDWRQVAWDAPSLWAALSIKFNVLCCDKKPCKAPPPPNTNRLILLQEWLARSTTCPLSLDLSVRTFPCKAKIPGNFTGAMADIPEHYLSPPTLGNRARLESETASIIELITKESHRWQDLRISLPRAYLKLLGATLELGLPALQSIEVRQCELYTWRGDILDYRLAIADAPNLRKAVLHAHREPAKDLPWRHLTHLVVHEFFVEELLGILRQTPALEDLSVRSLLWLPGREDGYNDDEEEANARPDLPIDHPQCVRLPRLRALHFHSDMGEGYSALIPLRVRTYMPALQEFEFEGDEAASRVSGDSGFALGPVFRLASRYRETLRRLAVRKAFFMSHRVVDEDLPSLYKLRELEIDAASTNPLSSISGAVLRALSLKTYAGGNEEFLPHLEVLSLTGAKDFGWSTLANIFPDYTAGGPGTSTPADATTDEISLVRAFRSVKVVCLASDFRTVDYIRPDDLCRLFAARTGGCRLEVNRWEWEEYDRDNYHRKSRPGALGLNKSDWLEASVERWQENIQGGDQEENKDGQL